MVSLAGFVFLDLDDVGTVGEPHGSVFFDGAVANSTGSLHAFEFDTQHHAAHGQLEVCVGHFLPALDSVDCVAERHPHFFAVDHICYGFEV